MKGFESFKIKTPYHNFDKVFFELKNKLNLSLV